MRKLCKYYCKLWYFVFFLAVLLALGVCMCVLFWFHLSLSFLVHVFDFLFVFVLLNERDKIQKKKYDLSKWKMTIFCVYFVFFICHVLIFDLFTLLEFLYKIFFLILWFSFFIFDFWFLICCCNWWDGESRCKNICQWFQFSLQSWLSFFLFINNSLNLKSCIGTVN